MVYRCWNTFLEPPSQLCKHSRSMKPERRYVQNIFLCFHPFWPVSMVEHREWYKGVFHVCILEKHLVDCTSSAFQSGSSFLVYFVLVYYIVFSYVCTNMRMSYIARHLRRLEKLGLRSTDLLLRTRRQVRLPRMPRPAITGTATPSRRLSKLHPLSC